MPITCKWGLCHNRNDVHSVRFFPFPKPCKYFNKLQKDTTLSVGHDITLCKKCYACQKWIDACKVEAYTSISQITRHWYICSDHFMDKEPTEANPHPFPAGSHPAIPSKPRKRAFDRSQLKQEEPADKITRDNANDDTSPVPDDDLVFEPTIQPVTSDVGTMTEIFDSDHKAELEKLHISLNRMKKRIAYYQKAMKIKQQKVRRKTKKVRSLKNALLNLKNNNILEEGVYTYLDTIFPIQSMKLSILKNEVKNSDEKKFTYSDDIKKFSQTLYYLSPKAYKYLRKQLILPHPSTLRKWISCDAAPGWTKESFEALKVVSFKNCLLMMDAIHLKSSLQWSSRLNKFIGCTDLGIDEGDDAVEPVLATEALFLMACGIKEPWKIPLGYFLTRGLTSGQQANIIEEAIERVHFSGCRVRGVTFDGARANLGSVAILGANIPDKPYFYHPINKDHKVHVILDNCHMVKLARNCLAKNRLHNNSGNIISWSHIEQLHSLQKKNGLRLGNKLTDSHVLHWSNQKMKVKLATQVLSRSVADSLIFCAENHDFVDVQPTVTFLRKIDQLFDSLNSRSYRCRDPLKRPITRKNILEFSSLFREMEIYLRALKDTSGKFIIDTQLQTFVKGFITSMKSTLSIASELFSETDLSFLLTYRMSQDALEHFFGDIRARGSWCTNPTPLYLIGSYRAIINNKLLLLGYSGNRNCQVFEDAEEDYSTLPCSFYNIHLSEFTQNVLHYVSGWIVHSLSKSSKCTTCEQSLKSNYSDADSFKLINIKQRGGLKYPSEDVIKVVNMCYNTLKGFLDGSLPTQKTINKIKHSIHQSALTNRNIFVELKNKHCLDSTPLENHVSSVIKSIISKFLNAYFNVFTKNFNEKSIVISGLRNKKCRELIFRSI